MLMWHKEMFTNVFCTFVSFNFGKLLLDQKCKTNVQTRTSAKIESGADVFSIYRPLFVLSLYLPLRPTLNTGEYTIRTIQSTCIVRLWNTGILYSWCSSTASLNRLHSKKNIFFVFAQKNLSNIKFIQRNIQIIHERSHCSSVLFSPFKLKGKIRCFATLINLQIDSFLILPKTIVHSPRKLKSKSSPHGRMSKCTHIQFWENILLYTVSLKIDQYKMKTLKVHTTQWMKD